MCRKEGGCCRVRVSISELSELRAQVEGEEAGAVWVWHILRHGMGEGQRTVRSGWLHLLACTCLHLHLRSAQNRMAMGAT